jgi:hypothetical protein
MMRREAKGSPWRMEKKMERTGEMSWRRKVAEASLWRVAIQPRTPLPIVSFRTSMKKDASIDSTNTLFTSVVVTGSKFIAGVVVTGENCSPVSM